LRIEDCGFRIEIEEKKRRRDCGLRIADFGLKADEEKSKIEREIKVLKGEI
jgi:hypothetical protein